MSTIGNVNSLYNNASPGVLATDTTNQDYKSQFLKLLLVQLQNQDPTQPYDSEKMLANQAQFASLEQMQNLNSNLIGLMAMQNVTQATSLLGKTVAGKAQDGSDVTGTVAGIGFANGLPWLNVTLADSTVVSVALSSITEIVQ